MLRIIDSVYGCFNVIRIINGWLWEKFQRFPMKKGKSTIIAERKQFIHPLFNFQAVRTKSEKLLSQKVTREL